MVFDPQLLPEILGLSADHGIFAAIQGNSGACVPVPFTSLHMYCLVGHDLAHDVNILFWRQVDHTTNHSTRFPDHESRLQFDESLSHVQMMVGVVRLGNH